MTWSCRVTAMGALLIYLAPCGCGRQSPAAQARKLLAENLAARRASRDKSMGLYKRGAAAHEAEDLEKACELLSKAVAVDNRNACAWMELGVVEFKRDRAFHAASAFDRAARLEPTRYEPHLNMGTVLESVGRYKEAINSYETAQRLAPDEIHVMENLARCYVQANTDLQKAKELVHKALLREDRPQWRAWLQAQVVRLNRKPGGKR